MSDTTTISTEDESDGHVVQGRSTFSYNPFKRGKASGSTSNSAQEETTDADAPSVSSTSSEETDPDQDVTWFVTHPLERLNRFHEDGLMAYALHLDTTKIVTAKVKKDMGQYTINPKSCTTRTLLDVLDVVVANYPAHPALHQRRGDRDWESLSWSAYVNNIYQAARGFLRLNVGLAASVLIIGSNSIEWATAYYGAIVAGGVAVGVVPTVSVTDLKEIVRNCKVRVLVLENSRLLLKFADSLNAAADLEAIILWGDRPTQKLRNKVIAPILQWTRFMELGLVEKKKLNRLLKKRRLALTPTSAAVICFTSGITGRPKGVLLSHDNLQWTAGMVQGQFGTTVSERHVSHMPLAHPAFQVFDLVGPAIVGYPTWFGPRDRTQGSLGGIIREIGPTFFIGTPKMYETLRFAIQRVIGHVSSVKQSTYRWSVDKGQATNTHKGSWLDCFCVANSLVFQEAKEKIGFQAARLLFSYGADLDPSVVMFFAGMDMPLFNIYGACEGTGIQTMSLPLKGWWREDSVGRVLPHTRVYTPSKALFGHSNLSSHSEEVVVEGLPAIHELTWKGRNIFMGYLNDRSRTKKAFTRAHYYRSGDYGWHDERPPGVPENDPLRDRPLVSIACRVSESYEDFSGTLVLPAVLEHALRSKLPAANYVCVVGEGRPYLVALITIKAEVKLRSVETTDILHDAAVDVFTDLGIIRPSVNAGLISASISNGSDETSTSQVGHGARAPIFTARSSIHGGSVSSGLVSGTKSGLRTGAFSTVHTMDGEHSSDDGVFLDDEDEGPITRVSQARRSPEVQTYFQTAIDEFNRDIDNGLMPAWVTPSLKICRFALMKKDFSPVTGEVDHFGRLRREAIAERHRKTIARLFGEDVSSSSSSKERRRKEAFLSSRRDRWTAGEGPYFGGRGGGGGLNHDNDDGGGGGVEDREEEDGLNGSNAGEPDNDPPGLFDPYAPPEADDNDDDDNGVSDQGHGHGEGSGDVLPGEPEPEPEPEPAPDGEEEEREDDGAGAFAPAAIEAPTRRPAPLARPNKTKAKAKAQAKAKAKAKAKSNAKGKAQMDDGAGKTNVGDDGGSGRGGEGGRVVKGAAGKKKKEEKETKEVSQARQPSARVAPRGNVKKEEESSSSSPPPLLAEADATRTKRIWAQRSKTLLEVPTESPSVLAALAAAAAAASTAAAAQSGTTSAD